MDAGSTITITIGRYKEESIDYELGSLIDRTVQEAGDYMSERGIIPKVEGDGDVVASLSKPKAKKGDTVIIKTKKSVPATS
ncbi:hypothetical protein D3C81_1884330 [compost metagenome]